MKFDKEICLRIGGGERKEEININKDKEGFREEILFKKVFEES